MQTMSSAFILLLLAVASCCSTVVGALSITRRDVLGSAAAAASSGVLVSSSWPTSLPANADGSIIAAPFSAYQINPDASFKLDPSLTSIEPRKLTQILSRTSEKVSDLLASVFFFPIQCSLLCLLECVGESDTSRALNV